MAPASLLSESPQLAGMTAESFAAHVLAQIAEYCGPQLPCYQSDVILKDFFARFGAEAGMAVCARAFTVHGGVWQGAPVTVRRFEKTNDVFFALPLLEEARAAR